MPLFSDIKLAKAVPDRALSKGEVDLIVAIRCAIQDELRAHINIPKDPVNFRIVFAELANEKGLASLKSFKRHMEQVSEFVGKHIPVETIECYSPEGERMSVILPMIQKAVVNHTKGYVDIVVSPEYQKYYALNIMPHPDLQLEKKFFLKCSCKYTYNFINWLSARIAEERANGARQEVYDIIVSTDELMKRVPSDSPSTLTSGGYRTKVVLKVIDDINSNEFSQFKILNRDDNVFSRKGRVIDKFIFKVKISPTEDEPIFTPHPDKKLINEQNVPSWQYITERLKRFGFGKSQWPKWEPYPEQTWKAFLYTVARHKTPQYMSSLFHANLTRYTVRSLACKVSVSAPEYIDDVIATIILYGTGEIINPLDEGAQYQTDDNTFFRELIKKNPSLKKFIPDKEEPDD